MPTIGVAVAIPEPWASQLQDYRTAVGDVTAAMIPTHVTLVPPTEIADDELPAVQKHLEEVATERGAFRVHLRGTGTFRPVSPVVFVTLVEGISECE
jgi:2'-5' RNA ligase